MPDSRRGGDGPVACMAALSYDVHGRALIRKDKPSDAKSHYFFNLNFL